MPYRSPLETRIAKRTTQAISDFQMLEDGDRVLVGLSGGKDSWALMQILDVLRRRAKIKFSLVAVNVDSGYAGIRPRPDQPDLRASAAGSAASSTPPSAR